MRWQYAAFGVDDLGTQSVEIPDWEVTGDAWLEPTTQAGASGAVVSTNGDLTSQPFTIDANAQHLLLDYQSASNSIFYVKLLRGPSFSQVVDLAGNVSGTATWQTLKVGIQPYAGETVKLRVDQYFGRGRYDNLGLQEVVLPGWTLADTRAVTTGEDQDGSWVQSARSLASLVSTDLSTGIIDSTGVDLRYFAISYDIGYRTGEMVRVYWFNRATGQSWVVFQDAANSPTGYRTGYFYVADFMGTDGYFRIQTLDAGKLYSIADNIPRQHLNEPFSSTVGTTIDTSTGSFGYEVRDLAAEGVMPLVFTRYYSGHADQYGTLGYRWSHSYDTRLVIDPNGGDAGVIFGSGRALFFDWNSVYAYFSTTDVRVHDTLVKNGDGTYTFTTTANLTYQFTSSGVLSSITDLNGNATTFTHDGSGRLMTVTDPGSRTLTLAYDMNGRLSTVTDPAGAVVTYGYDANGDLTTVTDPELEVWTYAYDQHRLVSVTDPGNHALFVNTFDDQHRVIAQTDAEGNPLTIAYVTPAKGVTSVTDRENNTARYFYDRYGRTTERVDPLGRVVSNIYDGDGNLKHVIDPANNAWEFAYDASGNLT